MLPLFTKANSPNVFCTFLQPSHTHLCVSKCCPVSVDLLVMVSYWLFAKRITGGSCSDLWGQGFSYLTTSPNSEVNKTLLTENTTAWTMSVLTQNTMVNLWRQRQCFVVFFSVGIVVNGNVMITFHAVTIMYNFKWILSFILTANGSYWIMSKVPIQLCLHFKYLCCQQDNLFESFILYKSNGQTFVLVLTQYHLKPIESSVCDCQHFL